MNSKDNIRDSKVSVPRIKFLDSRDGPRVKKFRSRDVPRMNFAGESVIA